MRRNKMRLTGWVGAAALALLGISGCGGGGGGSDENQTPATRLVGQWRAARITSGSQSTACPGEISADDDVTVSCGTSDTIRFRADNTFSAASADTPGTVSGTWQASGDTLTIAITEPSAFAATRQERLQFSGDDSFTVTDTTENVSLSFTRQ